MTKSKTQKNIKMKDSGVEWIGNIPIGWEVIVLKYTASLFNGNSIANKDLFLNSSNSYPYIATKDININNHNINYGNGIFIPKNSYKFKISKKNSTLLCIEGGNAGKKIAFSDRDICFGNKLCSIKSNNKYTSDKYIYYFTQNDFFKTQFFLYINGLIGGVSLYFIKNFIYLLPPKETQQEIVEFLDEKTGAVAEMVEKKKKMIELLKEKRSSIITHAVTKGLDENVEMKNSGVDWIGDIPEWWEIKKLKFISRTFASNVDKHSKSNEKSIFLCNYVDVYKNEEINNQLDFMKATAKVDQIRNFDIRKDNVLLTKDSETADDIGVPAYVAENFDNVICGYHLYISRPFGICGKYLFRFLQSHNVRQRFEVSSNGVTRFGLSIYPLINTKVLVPPKETQQKIVEYLDKKTAEIDQVIEKIQNQIKLLDEYKASLIYHAVTGKIIV